MFGGDLPSPNESQPATNLEHNGDLSGGNLGFQFDSATSSDVLAKGISSMLGSVIKDFDHRAENAIRSQDALSISIDRLTGELDQLLEDAPLPFIMQHAVKISGVRKRVSSLNSLLKSIQRRIDNIDRMLSVGSSHDLPNSQNVRQHQDTNKGSAGPETEPAKVQVDLPMTGTTDS